MKNLIAGLVIALASATAQAGDAYHTYTTVIQSVTGMYLIADAFEGHRQPQYRPAPPPRHYDRYDRYDRYDHHSHNETTVIILTPSEARHIERLNRHVEERRYYSGGHH